MLGLCQSNTVSYGIVEAAGRGHLIDDATLARAMLGLAVNIEGPTGSWGHEDKLTDRPGGIAARCDFHGEIVGPKPSHSVESVRLRGDAMLLDDKVRKL